MGFRESKSAEFFLMVDSLFEACWRALGGSCEAMVVPRDTLRLWNQLHGGNGNTDPSDRTTHHSMRLRVVPVRNAPDLVVLERVRVCHHRDKNQLQSTVIPGESTSSSPSNASAASVISPAKRRKSTPVPVTLQKRLQQLRDHVRTYRLVQRYRRESDELERLTQRWRRVCQEALAERLLSALGDRLRLAAESSGPGGFARSSSWGWDTGKEQREVQVEVEAEGSGDEGEAKGGVLGTLLRLYNIPWDLLGYDPDHDAFTDPD